MKKYVNNSFINKSPLEYKNGTEAVTSLPVTLYTDGQPVSSYTLKGNTTTSGTPSPSSPITIAGCGDKTANLSPISTISNSTTDSRTFIRPKMILKSGSTQIDYISYADVTSIGQQYFGFNVPEGSNCDTIQLIHSGAQADVVLYTITGTWNAPRYYLGVDFTSINPSVVGGVSGQSVMLVASSTTPSGYEPYGYKISISSDGAALSPIYLSEPLMKLDSEYANVQDELYNTNSISRLVGKAVLTGSEGDSQLKSPNSGFFYYKINPYIEQNKGNAICSHYETQQANNADMSDKRVKESTTTAFGNPDGAIIIKDTTYNTLADFKAFLAAQYSAGTPVTVYYVLTTPTTESITAPTITTTGGTATIDVDTTVKPSELDLTYHGWHSHEPLKRENGQWS